MNGTQEKVVQHTPGPWEIAYGAVNEYDEGFGVKSKIGDPRIVAECYPCTTTPELRRQLAADARLISAAPELLEACEQIVAARDRIADGGTPPFNPSLQGFDDWAADVCEAAIAKARGTN